MASNLVNIIKSPIENLTINMDKEEGLVTNITLNWLSVASCFQGRKDIFTTIQKKFETNGLVVLHGMPGIGKTETARRFGTNNHEYYQGNLIWIYAETPENIKKCYGDLAESLGLKIPDASQIFNKFKKSKALFVLDNVENMATVREYLPSYQLHPTVHVLITSRLCNWSSATYISNIPLNPLDEDDSFNIFKEKLGDDFWEDKVKILKKFAKTLDGIPLCLQIVSSLIQQQVTRIRLTEFKLEEYIKDLEESFMSSPILETETENYYNKTMYAAINSVLNRLEEVKAIYSLDVICFAGYLDADRIFVDDLLLVPSIKKSKTLLEEALNKLADYSLIQVEKACRPGNLQIKVHRIVLLVIREYDLKKRNGDMFKTVLRTFYIRFSSHLEFIFKHGKKDAYIKKTIEFVKENKQDELRIACLVHYDCYKALQIILPELKKNKTNTIINMLFKAINYENMKTIQVIMKIIAQNEEDMRQIDAALCWKSTKLIDIVLQATIYENNNNKIQTVEKFFHAVVEKSNRTDIKQVIECMMHLTFKWKVDILCKDYFSNKAIVSLLLDNNSSSNILHTACRNSEISLEIIKFLFNLENGKLKRLIDSQDYYKNTPLHNLFHYNEKNPELFEIFCYLVKECKADITLKNESGNNILYSICQNKYFKMIEFILSERNCSQFINVQNESGSVPFTAFIYNDSIEEGDKIKLVDLFVKNNIDLNLKNKWNKTFSDLAEEEGLKILAEEIKRHIKEHWTTNHN